MGTGPAGEHDRDEDGDEDGGDEDRAADVEQNGDEDRDGVEHDRDDDLEQNGDEGRSLTSSSVAGTTQTVGEGSCRTYWRVGRLVLPLE